MLDLQTVCRQFQNTVPVLQANRNVVARKTRVDDFDISLDVGICSRAKAIHIQLDLPTGHYIGFEYLRDAQIDGAEREQRDRRVAVYRNRSLELQIRARALNGGFLQCQHASAVISLNRLLGAELDFVFVRYR